MGTKCKFNNGKQVFSGDAMFVSATAVGGATADLTADGSINVTGKWDGAAATTDILVTAGRIEFYN